MTRDQIIESITAILECNDYTQPVNQAAAIVDQLGGEVFKFDLQVGEMSGVAVRVRPFTKGSA